MLTQKLGPESQPVAYLSKRLNPTASLALKSAVIAILIVDALKLFQGQTDYFYQPSSEITPKWEKAFVDV